MIRTFLKPRLLVIVALTVTLLLGATQIGQAAQVPPNPPPTPPDPKPFRLPFDEEPGADSWLITQWYGNTTFAYHWRDKWYEAGQGLHFGLDFEAACGLPVRAIGDGVVTSKDISRFGAGPFMLMIDHGNGFASLYGHLSENAQVRIGEEVIAGQVIGYTGDPDYTCKSRPHLHLEVRNSTYHYVYNPLDFIDADWDTLALLGPQWGFQQNLEAPAQWVMPDDQPMVDFWEPTLNDFRLTWPPDWSQ